MIHDNITLIGMPGAGKSTLGVVLAKKLGYRFVDCDLLIQENTGKLLSQILQDSGIEGFIETENKTIAALQCEHHIIATGGSAVYGDEAMRHLKSMSLVVFIDLSLEQLRSRLSFDLMERGIVIGKDETFEELYENRRPLYERWADLSICVDGLSTPEALQALEQAVVQR